MSRSLLYLLLFVLLLPACSKSAGSSKVVKPKYHHRWFDRKKDKRTKRTRVIKMKN